MPSSSGRPDTHSPNQVTKRSTDDSNTRSTIDVRSTPVTYAIHDVSSARLRDRVHIVTLEAEVELLQNERVMLKEQVTDLESEVESLNEEIARFEAADSCHDPQLQQVIDRYERIIAEKERSFEKQLEASETNRSLLSLPGVAIVGQVLKGGINWLRRDHTTGDKS